MTDTIGAKVCRQRLLEVLTFADEEGPLVPNAALRLVAESQCPQQHELQVAVVNEMLDVDERGWLRLNARGHNFLLGSGHPTPDWRRGGPPTRPLREWQVGALNAWADHGRVGVVEAVTGSGKSRVGIEAIREAVQDDYTALVVVPTVELVHQWIKALKDHGIRDVAQYERSSWQATSVAVGTVQAIYPDPPTRADGKVLLVADECHRYGAGQWRSVLQSSFRRRLGLTATFERNDDGLDALLDYFGGDPLFRIGFDRAIADGVVASYDVKLLPVELGPRERHLYDQVERTLSDARMQLLAADFPAEPFGSFLFEVKVAAEDDSDPTVSDVARRYLKAFSQRIDILAEAQAKVAAVRQLLPLIETSKGALVFTRRIETAENLTEELQRLGVRAASLHSGLTPGQRRDRLSALRARTVRALVAPTVLDEGIDVPEVDLGIVMAGSKSRRQMIQRMGRVLRAKPDRRSATFVVVYARDTVEDLTLNEGEEGCLDLIVRSASSVEELGTTEPVEVVATPCTEIEAPTEVLPAGSGIGDRTTRSADMEKLSGPAAEPEPDQEGTVRTLGLQGVDKAIDASPSSAAGTETPVPRAIEFIGALERLAQLFEQGLLTDEEFGLAKDRLLR